ncbi:MAG: lysylphosphatidylglycerol synthase domain-containing protein [Myxococcota bacterium]
MNAKQILRWTLPFVVSATLMSWLFLRIDVTGVLDKIDTESAAVIVPALLAYGLISLVLEAQSMARVLVTSSQPLSAWVCARVKAASYLFGILHYALGAGVLAVLLQRRARIGLADAAGAVGFLAVLDLGLLLFFAAVGASILTNEAPALRAGVLTVATLGLIGGFVFLRAPGSLGPLERIRNWNAFRAVRTTPMRILIELLLLRFFFVLAFIGLAAAALAAYNIEVPTGDLVINVAAVALIAALPIAFSGLGTGQAAFVYLFRHWSDPETLLACSLVLSVGLITLRVATGLIFARELTHEAAVAAKEVEV